MDKEIIDRKNQELRHTPFLCIGDCIIATDVNGIVRYVNHKVEQLMNLKALVYQSKKMMGK